LEIVNKRSVFYTELAYVFGLLTLAVGTALMTKGDFGVSMIVAPAYLLHLKLSQIVPFFSFGMAEYCLQVVILLLTVIAVRKFKPYYLFAIITAVLYGVVLDGAMLLVSFIPFSGIASRLVTYILGLCFSGAGVSLMFHTYITPESYELFVKEISDKFKLNITVFKTCYDCTSCVAALIMSFAFFGFGRFEGIGVGTVIVAFVNGWVIGMFTKLFERVFVFEDGTALRRFFK